MPQPKPVTYNGVAYPSQAALARALGMTSSTLSARVFRGETVEQAASRGAAAPRLRRYKEHNYRVSGLDPLVIELLNILENQPAGKSIAAACRKAGISRTCVRGWRLGRSPSVFLFKTLGNVLGYDLVWVKRDGESTKS